ncbi:MAG: hypothetical protein KF900_11730 [Bacteroidetes bacterium]|nr:hypothetical protein [Bacteroidota bacterium]
MILEEYNAERLAIALSNRETPVEVIKNKNHYKYLVKYLSSSEIGAQTIVTEEEYINKDYIQDYSFYYSLCFKEYSSKCKRIHFFSQKFSLSDLQDKILSPQQANVEFWDSYLGFIVVKPIPTTIIGFTILKTYASNEAVNSRNFFGLRKYNIHFFGTKIKIKSLAFQEQDSVLAACATTAIWSMLSKAALDYHTILKSPSEITKDADNLGHDGSRLFPNKDGLIISQICKAIYNSGLVTELKQPDMKHSTGESVLSNSYTKQIINAYSSIGIPIILIIAVPNTATSYGLHAITVSGIKQNEIQKITNNPEKVSYVAEFIEKLYAHDDQFGPFVRVEFEKDGEIKCPWNENDPAHRKTLVCSLVVSVYPKIRISYEDIKLIILWYDRMLSTFFGDNIDNDLVWDIKLNYSENFKKSIQESGLSRGEKLSILSDSLPKYIWVADCYIGTEKIISFTFDATDMINGMIALHAIVYFDGVKDELRQFISEYSDLFAKLSKRSNGGLYINHLINQLS